jgi:hypothetical protein
MCDCPLHSGPTYIMKSPLVGACCNFSADRALERQNGQRGTMFTLICHCGLDVYAYKKGELFSGCP